MLTSKLRWFRTYNDCHDETAWELQFWDDTTEGWIAVPQVECHESRESEYLTIPADRYVPFESDSRKMIEGVPSTERAF